MGKRNCDCIGLCKKNSAHVPGPDGVEISRKQEFCTVLKNYWWILLVALAILGLWSWCLSIAHEALGTPDKSSIGLYGDAFGSVNALFSGMALIGVVVAIILQKQELDETRKELKASAKAQKESVDIMKSQKERNDRAAFRRATPVLVSGRASVHEVFTTPKQIKLVWNLVNQSGPIFNPNVVPLFPKELPFTLIWHCPRILSSGCSLELVLSIDEAIGYSKLQDFEFILTCFDSDGIYRRQRYECIPSRLETIECVEPDLRIHENELENEDENLEYIP